MLPLWRGYSSRPPVPNLAVPESRAPPFNPPPPNGPTQASRVRARRRRPRRSLRAAGGAGARRPGRGAEAEKPPESRRGRRFPPRTKLEPAGRRHGRPPARHAILSDSDHVVDKQTGKKGAGRPARRARTAAAENREARNGADDRRTIADRR